VKFDRLNIVQNHFRSMTKSLDAFWGVTAESKQQLVHRHMHARTPRPARFFTKTAGCLGFCTQTDQRSA